MADLRLVEHYASVQCEGPMTGVRSQFVRFAGCNMRCPGWPCDTEYAIEPEIWRTNSFKKHPDDLLVDVMNMSTSTGARNVVLTGGEPFQQPKDHIWKLISNMVRYGLSIEAFTNGSFIFPFESLDCVRFMLDWKLQGSGEAGTKVENRRANFKSLREGSGVKFVVVDEDDLKEAEGLIHDLYGVNSRPTFWIGAAWGKIEPRQIVEWMTDRRFRGMDVRLNVQVHKYIWDPTMKGV